MGLIEGALSLIFGGGRNLVKETAEVFRENAESGATREAGMRGEALNQFGQEFRAEQRGLFDRFMDAVNRLPRPIMVMGVFALFVSAMFDPIWFAERMVGLALVPEPLWWLLGVIVSFYFGARHQIKGQEFQKSIAQTLAMAPTVVSNIAALRALSHDTPGVADTGTDAALSLAVSEPDLNPALTKARTQIAGGPGDR